MPIYQLRVHHHSYWSSWTLSTSHILLYKTVPCPFHNLPVLWSDPVIHPMSSMITKQVKITGLLSLNASAAIQGSAHKLYGGRVSAMKMFGWGFKEASNNRSMMMLCLKKINMEKRKSLNNNAVIFKSAFFQHKEQRGEEAEMRHQYWRASEVYSPVWLWLLSEERYSTSGTCYSFF